MSCQYAVVADQEAVVNDQIYVIFLSHKLSPETFSGSAFADESIYLDPLEHKKEIKEHN
jgi:hypothetical protein